MWLEQPIFREDMDYIADCAAIPWEKLEGKTLLVTGATGLIGFNLVSALAYAALHRGISLQIVAMVRDEAKARARFHEILEAGGPLRLVLGDLQHIPQIEGAVDYIVHGASPTASRYFTTHPVETIQDNLQGATSLLELARERKVQSFLFLSSMEVYGSFHRREKVSETSECFVDTMKVRNSYPEAKRLIEALCCAYAAEYGVPAKSLRLAQTFGAGVPAEDNRVFAQFVRSALAGEDIVLQTTGGTERSYVYTADAVTAILTVLLRGADGEAYNAANEETYCSILDMAHCVAELPAVRAKGKKISVVIHENPADNGIYPPEKYLNLDTEKIRALGWTPSHKLEDMFERMIATQKE